MPTLLSPARVFLATSLAAAAFGLAPAGRAAAVEPAPGQTVLHLTQTAEKSFPRDRLRVQLRVESTGGDARQAQADVNKRMTAALERARAAQGVKVETGGYSVYEEHPKTGGTLWHASQQISLEGGDFAAVLGIAGGLQGDGLVMSGMSFELAPETVRGAEDALTAEALRRLRDRAQRIAGSLQAHVLGIKDLRVGNADAQQPHPPMPFALAASARKMPTPAAEAGEATVRVAVEADFLLGQPGAGRP